VAVPKTWSSLGRGGSNGIPRGARAPLSTNNLRRVYKAAVEAGGWLGKGLARWRLLRFQPLPVEPCMRFSRTRLTDVLHRRCSTGARQGRFGLGAMTVPLREISPRLSGER
jgi:hypothetical protein